MPNDSPGNSVTPPGAARRAMLHSFQAGMTAINTTHTTIDVGDCGLVA